MNVPSWVDSKLFQWSLRDYFKNDSIEILGFSCKPAIPTGENYATDVFRVNITFARNNCVKEKNKETLSLIIKCVREGILETLATEMNLFNREIDMFHNILPKMNDIYGDKHSFAANCINASLKPHSFVMVEDICPLGFKVHERRAGLDLPHALKVLEKVAAFHATSVVTCKKNPSVLSDMYLEGIFPDKEGITNWIKIGFEALMEITENCKEFQSYHEKVKSIPKDDIIGRCMNSWQRRKGEFSVLNHGDLWINNIMFSYDANGKVNSCKLIDFQLAIYSSPAIDLHYFLTTSLANNIIKETDYLLDFYYAHLLVNLIKLGYSLENIPSRKEFRQDYQDRAFYGLSTMVTVLPLVKAENRQDASFEKFMADDTKNGFRNHCYSNEVYKLQLLRLLTYYDNLGVFL